MSTLIWNELDVGERGRPANQTTAIEAELRVPAVKAQLVHYHFDEPANGILRNAETYRVELCLTSRHPSARASYPGKWSPHRLERLGDLFLVPPGAALFIKGSELDPMTSIICELASESMRAFFDAAPAWTDQHLLASLDIQDAKVRSLLLRLAEETRNPGFANEMLAELVAGQLAIELVRHGIKIAECSARGGLAPWQLRRIDERLQEMLKAPTLSDLAALCRLSVRHLTRGFRASRGCSIGVYVANNQVKHAKRLLSTDESVTSIAHSLGFSSSSYFGYSFRRATGLTPHQFRQRLL